jgi:thiamine pyrophosphokinase
VRDPDSIWHEDDSNIARHPVTETLDQLKDGGDTMKAVVWAHLAIADAIHTLAVAIENK